MKTRILVAAVCLPALLVVIFFLPPWGIGAVVSVLAAIGSGELVRCFNPKTPKWLYAVTALCALTVAAMMIFGYGETAALTAAFVLLAVTAAASIRDYGRTDALGTKTVLAAIFGGALIPYFLSALTGLAGLERGRLCILLPLVAAFVSDSGAYFVGKAMGKHKAFPAVSPHKTVEGCAGSLISGVLGMLLYGLILHWTTDCNVRFGQLLVYGILGNLATQLGDLTFSLMKRECGIKDYGRLFPGHGGVLDRFDSMIFAAPVLYGLMLVIPAI